MAVSWRGESAKHVESAGVAMNAKQDSEAHDSVKSVRLTVCIETTTVVLFFPSTSVMQ